MSDERPLDPADGGVTTEVRGRILLMGLDRPAKMNGYTPQMARQLVAAFERLHQDDDLWCCLFYPSDAADDMQWVALAGPRIHVKKTQI